MGIKEYDILPENDVFENGLECYVCGTQEDIVLDEGDPICTDCLFERDCEKHM